jgi:type II secretory pathway predicted ATPase ExeA
MTRAPWAAHFGFTKLPFSKSISAKDLLDRALHQEAVARIRFCVAESLLGVITGEVGVGKTVAVRAAMNRWTMPPITSCTSLIRPLARAGCT